MNKLAKSGALTFGTAAFIFGSVELGQGLIAGDTISPEQHNRRVRLCAAQLGETATQSEKLPNRCEEVTYLFPYITTRSVQYDPSGESKLLREGVTFLLPSRDTLLAENLVDVDKVEKFNLKLKIVMSLFGGLMMGAGYWLSPVKNAKVKDLEGDDEE